MERAELHLHTNMSAMDGTSSAEKLIRRAVELGHKAVAITDHGVVQAFPAAMRAADEMAKQGQDIKVLYGVEVYFVDDCASGDIRKLPVSHLTLLAQNKQGIKNLYKLISVSHLQYCYRGEPLLPRSELEKHRDGLLVGSACRMGELFQAVMAGEPWEKLCQIAGFYDYLEIQPSAEQQIQRAHRTVAELGDALGIPVCATGDVHFCLRSDELCHTVLVASRHDTEPEEQPPQFLRSTDEMLEEFTYLGADKAFEVVVRNPNRIADSIQRLRPIPEGSFFPHIDGAEDTLQESVWGRAKQLYGEPLPAIVKDRLEKELAFIINNGHATQYVIAQKLAKDAAEHGYRVMSRGAAGSSLTAYMAGFTDVNPLVPHYVCPKCRRSEFITDGSVGSGFDLHEKNCPVCGTTLRRDGHDIPLETFMGFDGKKVPDIDLSIAAEYQPAAYECLCSLFGREHVLKAGTFRTISYKSAIGLVKAFAEEQMPALDEVEIERLAQGCVGVKRFTGQHFGSVLIVPEDYDANDFTPVQYPANDPASGVVAAHFSCYDLQDTLLKLDILSNSVLTMYKYLEGWTGVSVADVPLCDPEVYSLLASPKALGVTPEEIGCETGTLALPELETETVRQMLTETQPKDFTDLMQISGLYHGTGVWADNGQELIRDGICSLSEVIASRDGIMTYLVRVGIEPKMAYEIMDAVGKGQAAWGLTEEQQNAMRSRDVPEWYIESCMNVRYLFPEAHLASCMMASVRLGWYKLHWPAEYYAALFTVHRQAFDGATVMKGKEAVHQALKELRAKEHDVSWGEIERYHTYQAVYEAMARGIVFLPSDLGMSRAKAFLAKDGKIIIRS